MRRKSSALRIMSVSLCAALCLCLNACHQTEGLPLPSPHPTKMTTSIPDAISLQTRIAAGFTPTSPPTQTPFPVATNTPTPAAVAFLFEEVNPLTGKPIPEGEQMGRPLLIKMANWPETLRPSSGLNQADMVFEYYIGHQMNHLLALFSSTDADVVGPMAPARPLDMTLTDLYQANLAVSGAEPTGEETLQQRFPDRVAIQGFLPCPAICADFSKSQERTVANTSALKQFFQNNQTETFIADLDVNTFSLNPASNAELGTLVSVEYADFSVMQWRFNQTSGKYELWQDHQKQDGKYELIPSRNEPDGLPVAFENVIIVYSKYIQHRSNSFDLSLVPYAEPGQALFFRDGRISYGLWQIEEINQPLKFSILDGTPYRLKPGSTWVVFVSENTTSNQSAPGEWQVSFSIQ